MRLGIDSLFMSAGPESKQNTEIFVHFRILQIDWNSSSFIFWSDNIQYYTSTSNFPVLSVFLSLEIVCFRDEH